MKTNPIIKKVFKVVQSTIGINLTEAQACKILEIKNEILKRWVANGIIKPDKFNQFKKSDIENLKSKITK